jgi:transcriptional antiterminator RfaH
VAAYLLQHPEVEALCARLRLRKRTTRGPVWFVESMFPGYFFARFDYATFHRRVRQGRGIRGFVQFGDRFGLLPDKLIDQLKARVGENEVVEISQPFVPGQNVQISQGPFQGLEALVTRSIAGRTDWASSSRGR